MNRRAFLLADLGAVIALVLAVGAMIVLLSADQRRMGRLGEDIGKLGRIGALTGDYAADYADKFWTFSWRKGESHSQYPDLNNAPTDLQAGANQAVDILRRRAGRADIAPIVGWFAHKSYSHLPLADYGARLPDETFISAADTHRLRWARDPGGYDSGVYQPSPTGSAPGTNAGKRWPYSASFQLPAAFYDRGTVPNRIYQGSLHTNTFVPGGAVFGAAVRAEVAHPAAKVHMSDSHARHFGVVQPYAVHSQARLPLLFSDGSVVVRHAQEANEGWQPNAPTAAGGSTFAYSPDVWEPPTVSSPPGPDWLIGHFLWTRGTQTEGGIAGRDFGKETCSGQNPCE